jgi:hypothetical protein
MAAKRDIPVDPASDARFDRAFEQLRQLVDLDWADQRYPVRNNAVYTTSVVLWMLVYQRMNPDNSLEAAVKKLLRSPPDFLPKNKRVEEGTLSTNTSGYSQARSRMPAEAARWFAHQVSQSLIEATLPTWEDRRVFLIDGTTITLAPEEELQQAFPPATNQHGEGVWPVALLTVAHELSSGAALLPEVGPMYGEQAVSETALVGACVRQLPADSVVMADAGFGIFAVAKEIADAGHQFVLRMTRQRFESIRRKAELIEDRGHSRTYAHRWRPTPKERRTHPQLSPDDVLEVRLYEIVINKQLTLLLVTDGCEAAGALADLYEARVHVEIDIRNLKVVLDAENIRAQSVSMFEKELMTSMVSYNLVSQFRAQAAELIGQPPRRMSFKRIWTTFRTFLLSAMHTEPAAWRAQYREALRIAMQDKLPNRPGRSYEREAYPRRSKSSQFKKRKRKPDSS